MNIESIVSENGFLHAERYVNNPKYSSTAQYSEVSPAYHPRHGAREFQLPFFNVPTADVDVWRADPSRTARAAVECGEKIRFFVHPDSLEEFNFGKPDGFVAAVPTSSTRTVYLGGDEPLMLKLHLNRRVSRFIRRMSASSARHSVDISRELGFLTTKPDCPKEFAFLPESMGVSIKSVGAGFVVRECRARPRVESPRFLIPFFALYSKDEKHPKDETLLSQILSRHAGGNPFGFFSEHILTPFISSWVYGFVKGGILLESHGQNTLLEVDESFMPTRIVQRDFQSVPIDPLMRERNKLHLRFVKHVIGEEDYPRFLEQSLLFDHFVGDYLLTSLADFFESRYGVRKEDFQKETKRIFRVHLPLGIEKQFFPKGHVVFGDKVENNLCELVYRHEDPAFRAGYGL